MAVRRGMADYRQAGAGGIIFMGLLQAQGEEMSYEQRKILYRSLYSAMLAKVELTELGKHLDRVDMLIGATKILLDQAGTNYLSIFENHASFSTAENNYSELLAQILDSLWEIAMKGKLIENIVVDQEMVG